MEIINVQISNPYKNVLNKKDLISKDLNTAVLTGIGGDIIVKFKDIFCCKGILIGGYLGKEWSRLSKGAGGTIFCSRDKKNCERD